MKGFFRRLGEIWMIAGVTLLLFILIELFFRIYFSFSTSVDSRVHADCYYDEAWVEEYYSEFSKCNNSHWEPYVYWKRKPFSGKYIKIDQQGYRVTLSKDNPLSHDRTDLSVFFFGGSTMWGSGVRDTYTIPSLSGAELSKTGINADITNFGESGYVSSQELTRLILELKNGKVPDIVVFYNGVNDIFSSYQSGEAGIPQNEYNRQKEFNTLKEKKKSFLVWIHSLSTLATVRFVRGYFGSDNFLPEYQHSKALADLAKETVQQYNENIRIINALAKQYGFKVIFYWQPTIFNKDRLTDYEKQEKEKVGALTDFNAMVNEKLFKDDLHHENIYFYNLSGILKGYHEPLFIDWCHLGEDGNVLISRRIVKDMMPIIDSLHVNTQRINE